MNYKYLLIIVFMSKAYSMQRHIVPGEIYEHTRTKRRYKIVGIARSTEDRNKKLIIYEQLYEGVLEPDGIPLPLGSLWARPEQEFFEITKISSNICAPRFKKVINT
jgi:hypothetical protein